MVEPSFAIVRINITIFVLELKRCKRRCSLAVLWLFFLFFFLLFFFFFNLLSLPRCNHPQFFHYVKFHLPIIAVSANVCFLPPNFHQLAIRTATFNLILGNSSWGNAKNLDQKIFLLTPKSYVIK